MKCAMFCLLTASLLVHIDVFDPNPLTLAEKKCIMHTNETDEAEIKPLYDPTESPGS